MIVAGCELGHIAVHASGGVSVVLADIDVLINEYVAGRLTYPRTISPLVHSVNTVHLGVFYAAEPHLYAPAGAV